MGRDEEGRQMSSVRVGLRSRKLARKKSETVQDQLRLYQISFRMGSHGLTSSLRMSGSASSATSSNTDDILLGSPECDMIPPESAEELKGHGRCVGDTGCL
jgi:hypothetical protein